MVDQRLIDYSSQYKDYKKTLQEEGELFTLEDMMSVIEGFVTNYAIDPLNNKERELLINLGKLHSKYQDS